VSFVANGRSFSKSASSLSQVHTDTELSSTVASSLAPAAAAAATLTTSNLSASRLHTRATVVRINSTYLRERERPRISCAWRARSSGVNGLWSGAMD